MKPDRFESTDRLFSSFVVVCDLNGTRYYLKDIGSHTMYTDKLDRATTYGWEHTAKEDAAREETDPNGIKGWRVIYYAQAFNERPR